MIESYYAVAVDDDIDSWVILTVRRSATNDLYVNFPRDGTPDWKPHTSYHASGQHHQKSFGKTSHVHYRAKPDVSFKDTENLVTTGVVTGEAQAIGWLCNPSQFKDVLRIPDSEVRPQRYCTYLAVRYCRVRVTTPSDAWCSGSKAGCVEGCCPVDHRHVL